MAETGRRIPWTSKLLRVVTLGAQEQNFLGQPAIPLVLKLWPKRGRRWLALRIVAASPHYFILQGTYPGSMSRGEVLEAEYRRMSDSRRHIREALLGPYLASGTEALDFGCGPGFLAREVAAYVKSAIAVDISAGAIACAQEICPRPNLTYRTVNGKDLSGILDSSLDLVYSFAVIQHMSDAQMKAIFREFHRVLRPGGKVVCHLAIAEKASHAPSGILGKRLLLRMAHRDAGTFGNAIRDAGFGASNLVRIGEIAKIEDDLGQDYLAILEKSGVTSPLAASR